MATASVEALPHPPPVQGAGETKPTQRSISDLSHDCNTAFKTFLHGLPSSSYKDLENPAADEAGRFKIWAANIGALQPPRSKSSLDSRLQKADRMRKFVKTGLERLEGALAGATAIASGTRPNRTTLPVISEEEAAEQSVQTVIHETAEDHEDQNKTEFAELFLEIQASITHLFTLSTLIRRDRPRGQTARRGGHNLLAEPGPDISNAKDKFPKLKETPWLAERVGKWTNQRREYIRYRQTHRRNLARIPLDPVSGAFYDDISSRATTKATSFHELPSQTSEAVEDIFEESTERSMITVATSFATTAGNGIYQSGQIPYLTDVWLDGVQLGYNQHLECPYCRTIQFIQNSNHWKHHVYADLQMYICTFEDCSVEPFRTSHDWFKHELDEHRREWACYQCHEKYGSASALENHLLSQHAASLSKAQSRVMIKSCEKAVSTFDGNDCPFCNDWANRRGISSDRFRSHVAKHLQQLARSALPLAIDGLEIRNAESDDDVSSESDDDSTNSSLIFNHFCPIALFCRLDEEIYPSWRCILPGHEDATFCLGSFETFSQHTQHLTQEHKSLKVGTTTLRFECVGCHGMGRSFECQICGNAGRGTYRWLYASTNHEPFPEWPEDEEERRVAVTEQINDKHPDVCFVVLRRPAPGEASKDGLQKQDEPQMSSTADQEVPTHEVGDATAYGHDKGSVDMPDNKPADVRKGKPEDSIQSTESPETPRIRDMNTIGLESSSKSNEWDGNQFEEANTAADETRSNCSSRVRSEDPEDASRVCSLEDPFGIPIFFLWRSSLEQMKEFMRERLALDDEIGPRVVQDQYDIVDGDGNKLSPFDWENLKAGSYVYMKMWPVVSESPTTEAGPSENVAEVESLEGPERASKPSKNPVSETEEESSQATDQPLRRRTKFLRRLGFSRTTDPPPTAGTTKPLKGDREVVSLEDALGSPSSDGSSRKKGRLLRRDTMSILTSRRRNSARNIADNGSNTSDVLGGPSEKKTRADSYKS